MVFQITNYCEMECPHCMSVCSTKGIHATLNTIEQMCIFAKKYNPKTVLISGGEPTQHPDFIDYFEIILKELYNRCAVILASNGDFLFKNKIRDNLIKLNKEFLFAIQISSIKGLYKRTSSTQKLFKKYKRKFKMMGLIEEITVIDQLGRATGKDWSKFTTYKRKAPNCFNLLSCAYSPITNSFRDVIFQIHNKNACKPFITPEGNIHVGESHFCHKIGTIWDNDPTLYNNIKKVEPCGKCGAPIDQFKLLKSAYGI